MLSQAREVCRLVNFMFWAAVIACDDLLFRGRRRWAWRDRLPLLVSSPSRRVAAGWAVVTGANSGIGLQTAKLLARSGVSVALACRNKERGERAAAEVAALASGGAQVQLVLCDVADLRSVAACAAEIERRGLTMSLLVNNAGVMVCPWEATQQKYEVQFGTHHLGHALLTQLLLDQHRRRGEGSFRTVFVGSAACWGGRWRKDMFEQRSTAPPGYDRYKQYSDVKTAQLLYAYHLADLLKGSGKTDLTPSSVTVNTIHPGCPNTPVIRHMPLAGLWEVLLVASPFQITVEEAGCYVLQLCSSPELENLSGTYYHTNGPLRSDPVTYDDRARRECWALTQEALAPYLSAEQQQFFKEL
eukprot:TRINITY_DN15975_c0_g1_i1.p1 TRINITY_DN15975_c0_g1~~TRINITY_DN15975_c0_g1_i1.p1  ORF type:complete len:358 (+),score=97.43 TRINITY_DN15975_c0_g1_i1:89-1162(+)